MSGSRPSTIPALVHDAAIRYPQSVALEGDDRSWTFPELADACRVSTRAFMAAGISPGDRVAIWAPNSPRWIIAAVGLQSAGAALVPMNTRFKRDEAADILSRTKASLLVTVGDFLGTRYLDLIDDDPLPALEHRVLLDDADERAQPWEEFLDAGKQVSIDVARARTESIGPDDLADIMFTSGTTGRPKGVTITHGQNLFAYERWTDAVGLRHGDRYLIVNPFFHAFGYKAGWMACIMRGCTILPEPVLDVDRVLRRVGEEKVSVLPGTPPLYESLLMHPNRSRYDLQSLRLAITGGAAIAPELIHRVYDELGFDTAVTGYGLTETAGVATQNRAGTSPETIALTSGPPLPDIDVIAVDSSGCELGPGESGEIMVRGPNVTRAFLDDPEATADAIDPEGWLHTGDIGFFDADGNIHITDRLKDMYIMGGFNCYPAEIERIMYEMPEIAQVAVIGVPDKRMGEVGKAFIVATPGTSPSASDIIAWCREEMSNFKVPRSVEFVESLPTTASGKIQKHLLQDPADQPG